MVLINFISTALDEGGCNSDPVGNTKSNDTDLPDLKSQKTGDGL